MLGPDDTTWKHRNTQSQEILLIISSSIHNHNSWFYLTVILCANSNTSSLCLIQLTRLLLLLHNKVLLLNITSECVTNYGQNYFLFANMRPNIKIPLLIVFFFSFCPSEGFKSKYFCFVAVEVLTGRVKFTDIRHDVVMQKGTVNDCVQTLLTFRLTWTYGFTLLRK